MKNWAWDGVGKDFRAQADGVFGEAVERFVIVGGGRRDADLAAA